MTCALSGQIGSQTVHWPESCLESSVIALDPVVGELGGVVEHFWEKVVDGAQQRCSQISRDLSWPVMACQHRLDEPAITDTVPARPSRIDDQRGEALHPPINRHVINVDTTFRE